MKLLKDACLDALYVFFGVGSVATLILPILAIVKWGAWAALLFIPGLLLTGIFINIACNLLFRER